MFNFGPKNGLSNADNNKDEMHPQDMRNMFMFFIFATILYFTYDAFILKPQAAQIKARAKAEAAIVKEHGPEVLKDLTQIVKKQPREDIISAGGRVEFDNGEVFGSISLKGGRIDDLSLREYFKTQEEKKNVSVLSPRGSAYPRTIDYGWVAQDSNVAVPNKDTIWSARGNRKLTQENPVTLIWNNGQGLTFERTLQLDEHYMFTITQSVQNNSGKDVTLFPYGILAQRGLPEKYQWMWISHEGPVAFIGDKLEQPYYDDLREEKKQSFAAQTGWIGITEKYWLTALIPPQNQQVQYNYTYAGDEDDKTNNGLYQADFLGQAVTLSSGQKEDVESRFYAGAKKVLLLQDYEKNLGIHNIDLAVDFGWFWFLTYPFFYALHFIGIALGNMGAAIIVLTLIIRGMAFPLTNISYRSFAKMKKVAPQVAELKKKHGDDKQEMQKDLIAMYSREGVNPMAGCLPILLQIPIFFALYKVFFITIELRHAPFFGWIQDLSAPDPTSIFNLFGLLPFGVPAFLMIGVWPCMMLLAMVIQKKLNPPPTDPLQRDLANYMPFIFAFIMSRFAAGLVVYWTFSAFIGIIQQIIIMRSLNVPIHLFGEEEQPEIEGVHPLVEMAEDDLEEAMFGDEEGAIAPAKPISKPKPKKSKKSTGKKKK
jgi:YidC/Oxa1 family membrane protein insertase